MNIRCGNCKESHGTVQEIQKCYKGTNPPNVSADTQLTLVDGQPRTQSIYERVPAGHYAVDSLTGNNDLDFFVVEKPTDGKWAGYVFVKRVIGGRENQRITRGQQGDALRAILDAGTNNAGARYGQAIGRCWKCHRHLTDETSRSLGIGPDCRAAA